MNFDDILAGAKPKQDTVWLCLNGELQEAYEEIAGRIEIRAAERAEKAEAEEAAGTTRLATKTAEYVDPEQGALDAAKEALKPWVVAFRVKAIPAESDKSNGIVGWNELFAAHPPRTDKATGKRVPKDVYGVNFDTFFAALLRLSVFEPEMTAERWAKVDAILSDGQFDRLAVAAWNVNQRVTDLPF
jgi:hypothetical protein